MTIIFGDIPSFWCMAIILSKTYLCMYKNSWSLELPSCSSGIPTTAQHFSWKSECIHDKWCIISSHYNHKDPYHHILPELLQREFGHISSCGLFPNTKYNSSTLLLPSWFFSHNLVNTPFFQIIVKNFIIIIPDMSWIKFVNIIVQFTTCNPTWFNTGRCINNALFL